MTILILAFLQSISFTLVSRARNRDSWTYHLFASILSNGIWIVTMRHLITGNMDNVTLCLYVVGTVSGSLTGAYAGKRIEGRIDSAK